jgi:predicted ATPase
MRQGAILEAVVLRSFRVANHKSIRDEAELALLPAYDKTRPAVPVAAVLGANASGKSNLLDALRWMRVAVEDSYASWKPGSGVPRMPFRLDPRAGDEPSAYCVEVVVDGVRYTYGVEVDYERVREEWLYTYPHNRRRVIFEREGDRVAFGSTMPDYRARGEALRRQTRDNALFLSVAAHNNVAEVQPVYAWFEHAVIFGDGESDLADSGLRRRLRSADRDSIVELIRAADLGITDVTDEWAEIDLITSKIAKITDPAELARRREQLSGVLSDPRAVDLIAFVAEASFEYSRLADDEPAVNSARSRPRLVFHHGNQAATMSIEEQSAGTRSWIGLVSLGLDALERGALLVVDEVDASLHPHLTARLINLFRDAETNPGGAQLLFTTHDATLLDEDTLSRDEIWFVEKDLDSGATRLFQLTDFHPRKNENTEGRYLAGGYGAIPVLSDHKFREAIRIRRENNDEAA